VVAEKRPVPEVLGVYLQRGLFVNDGLLQESAGLGLLAVPHQQDRLIV